MTTYSSKVKEALSHVKNSLSLAYAVLYEHSFQHDIKLHSPDKLSLNSPQLSVSSASPKSPFDKVAPVQHGGSTPKLCPTLYTGKKEKHLSHPGDKSLCDENTHQPVVNPLIIQGSSTQVPEMFSHLYPPAVHTDHHYGQAKA